MNYSPSSSYSWSSENGLGDKYPAYFISYNECEDFIDKLNRITGAAFRMPTEAEWEYAARGGNKSNGYIFSGSNNVGDVAWYKENSDGHTHEVGTKSPNELGIYDMSGNVYEWCADWHDYYSRTPQINPIGPYEGSYRVFRGGGFTGDPNLCRVSERSRNTPDHCFKNRGLRLVLEYFYD